MACFVDADAVNQTKDAWLTLDALAQPRYQAIHYSAASNVISSNSPGYSVTCMAFLAREAIS
jgi:hypothetical protein